MSQLMVRFHHITVALTFLLAVGRLLVIEGFDFTTLLMFIAPPLVALRASTSARSKRWDARLGTLFLFLIGLGAVLASFDFLPTVNIFPKLPAADNRLLSWYVCVYLLFFAVILPPYWHAQTLWFPAGGKPSDLSRFIAWLSLILWAACMALVVSAIHWLTK